MNILLLLFVNNLIKIQHSSRCENNHKSICRLMPKMPADLLKRQTKGYVLGILGVLILSPDTLLIRLVDKRGLLVWQAD